MYIYLIFFLWTNGRLQGFTFAFYLIHSFTLLRDEMKETDDIILSSYLLG
jgi:hypothetical protein